MKYNYKKVKLLTSEQQEFINDVGDWRYEDFRCRDCGRRVFKYMVIDNPEIIDSYHHISGSILCPECYDPPEEFDYEENGWHRCCVCGELQSPDRLEYYQGDWYCHTDDNTCLPEEYWDDDCDEDDYDYDDEDDINEDNFDWDDPDEVLDNIDFANGWG
jgi:hypothetical protein